MKRDDVAKRAKETPQSLQPRNRDDASFQPAASHYSRCDKYVPFADIWKR